MPYSYSKFEAKGSEEKILLFAFILNYYNIIILFLLLSKQCIDFSF